MGAQQQEWPVSFEILERNWRGFLSTGVDYVSRYFDEVGLKKRRKELNKTLKRIGKYSSCMPDEEEFTVMCLRYKTEALLLSLKAALEHCNDETWMGRFQEWIDLFDGMGVGGSALNYNPRQRQRFFEGDLQVLGAAA